MRFHNGCVTALIGCLLMTACPAADDGSPGPEELFQQRIMPIFRSPNPASCVQCHLSSVDLKDYIRPSHEQTFASLRDQGLINLDTPQDSKILKLIAMGEQDPNEGTRLIHQDTRRAELDAFSTWITACCNDPELRALPALSDSDLARPAVPDAVIRHTRHSRLVDSFTRNIWSQRMRCFPCHTPHELDESDPKQRMVIKRQHQFLEEHGERYGDRLTIFHETPEATMRYLIERSLNTPEDELPLLNLEQPEHSLLVLKPTSRLPAKNDSGGFEDPSYSIPTSHMGGLKMHHDDQSYKAFLAWIQDYASVTGGQYTAVEDLPADNWYPTKHAIIMRQLPETWPDASRIQFFVHSWNSATENWSDEPVAFTQTQMGPARNAAGVLFVFGPHGHEAAAGADHPDAEQAQLPPGRYLLKVCLDHHQRLQDDPTLLLGEDDLVGQAEIEAQWGEGFPQAEKLLGSILQPTAESSD